MTITCAWCGSHLRGPAVPEGRLAVSHGICPTCERRMMEGMGSGRAVRVVAVYYPAPRGAAPACQRGL